MEEAPVTAATGALGPVISKLGALLSNEYKLRRRTRRDVNIIKSKLMSVHSLLWNIWEREDLDEASKALKMEALDLADDMDSAVDDFVLSLERSHSSMRFIQTEMKARPFEDLKKRVYDVSGSCRGKWKKKNKNEKTSLISSLFSRKQATVVSVAGKPRVHPFVRKDASQLVGMARHRNELISYLVREDESTQMELQLKMASIIGMAGLGKTTLADLVYQAIGDRFHSRAFVSLTPGGNMKEVLARIFEQLVASSGVSVPVAGTQAATEEEISVTSAGTQASTEEESSVPVSGTQAATEEEISVTAASTQASTEEEISVTAASTQASTEEEISVTAVSTQASTEEESSVPADGTQVSTEEESSVPAVGTQAATKEEHLIDIISNFLKDKRYLVIIDDIWHDGAREFIKKCFPQNNLGSRIIMTTRIDSIGKKWDEDFNIFHYKMKEKNDWWKSAFPGYVADIPSGMKPDMVGEDFDFSHPVVSMCDDLPLALACMFSALAKVQDRQEQQGLCVNTTDLQNSIHEQVKRNGIQNTPGFEPLVESLQLGYDDLPHNMLKTCLLYCSIYNGGRGIVKDAIVSRLMAERFVYEQEAAEGYFDELVNRGLIWLTRGEENTPTYRMHSMMRTFLRWKSLEDNFIACSSDVLSSYTTSRIRRLCIDSPLNEPLSGLDWSRIRSLVVFDPLSRTVPWQRLDHLQVLDLGGTSNDHHLKVVCGLVCPGLRHLLGLGGWRINEIPPEIERLRHLESLEVRKTWIRELAGEIGGLPQLKTLVVSCNEWLRELPSEIGGLQQLNTLVVYWNSRLEKLPSEIGGLQQLQRLVVSKNEKLEELPRAIGGLQQLKSLVVRENKRLKELPSEIGSLQQLKTLVVSRNSRLEKLPSEIGGLQQLQTLVLEWNERLEELPSEIGGLQQLKTLVVCENQRLKELPSEIGNLQRLKTLDVTGSRITELPKEIGKLKCLEQLILSGTTLKKVPREVGGLNELKILTLHSCEAALPLELWRLTKLVEFPECIGQAWNKSDVMSSLARENLSFKKGYALEGGLVVGAKQMRIPRWIEEHFNDLRLLDIRICKLEEEGLKILREMPHLRELKLRFEVVPRKPIAISREGFATLEKLVIDSRAPRVTFQQGAMPMLQRVTFEFQFYGGPPNKDPLGIKHLQSLEYIDFECKDCYRAGNPCMSATIDVVRKEAHELMQTRIYASQRRPGAGTDIILLRVSGHQTQVFSEYNMAWTSQENHDES